MATVWGALVGAVLGWTGYRADATTPSSGVVVASPAGVTPSLLRRIENSVVVVEGDTCAGRTYGSGVLVGDERVLTNRHVIDHATAVRVVDRGGSATGVAAVRPSLLDDSAMLNLADEPDAANPVAQPDAARRPSVGTSVVLAGHPRGGALVVRRGRITGPADGTDFGADRGTVWRTDIEVAPGDSGGGVFDQHGALVGLVFSRADADGTAVVLPAERLSVAVSFSQRPHEPTCAAPPPGGDRT